MVGGQQALKQQHARIANRKSIFYSEQACCDVPLRAIIIIIEIFKVA